MARPQKAETDAFIRKALGREPTEADAQAMRKIMRERGGEWDRQMNRQAARRKPARKAKKA